MVVYIAEMKDITECCWTDSHICEQKPCIATKTWKLGKSRSEKAWVNITIYSDN